MEVIFNIIQIPNEGNSPIVVKAIRKNKDNKTINLYNIFTYICILLLNLLYYKILYDSEQCKLIFSNIQVETIEFNE